MAVGDQVVLRVATLNNESGDERLLVGLVNAEAAGPPATADVLWENGELNTVQQTELLKAFTTPPGDFNVIGKWAQL
nr:hypothetical protein [Gammaproteobacteria bacterium]NIR86005.1 hypothetical protein [Gammaproteobacteria bacterium]NIU07247.1 hypothetical protein [Gammaproteobacteria bacterium]NIV54052.1 hypothetical protein [Gammaproteobacteria bacterium]NIX88520.1 hypothetical protein [Gammaproteobacteria bacterium]